MEPQLIQVWKAKKEQISSYIVTSSNQIFQPYSLFTTNDTRNNIMNQKGDIKMK